MGQLFSPPPPPAATFGAGIERVSGRREEIITPDFWRGPLGLQLSDSHQTLCEYVGCVDETEREICYINIFLLEVDPR